MQWRVNQHPQHRLGLLARLDAACLSIPGADTDFCEYVSGKPAVPHWFAQGAGSPLLALAGLWRPWTGTRGTKTEPAEG